MEQERYTVDDLLNILKTLRGENGCPWDRAQTHESIRKSMIEETYEAIDALNNGDDKAFSNELGDVLLQVGFHAVMAEERGAFDFDDIVREICTKLITRHTHVFGEDKAASAEEALGNWEKNKKKEKGLKTNSDLLNDVPHSLPALMRAEKVQKKAASCGFDWKNCSEVLEKVHEEEKELLEAVDSGLEKRIAEEYGDLLFSVVNLGRHLKLNPETVLADATDKFIKRFTQMEKISAEEGYGLDTLSAPKMDVLWKKAKQKS